MTEVRTYEWWSEDGIGPFTVNVDWTPSNVARCKGCRRMILWVTTKAGKKMPVDQAGTSHFVTCPEADQFRRRPEEPPFPGMS